MAFWVCIKIPNEILHNGSSKKITSWPFFTFQKYFYRFRMWFCRIRTSCWHDKSSLYTQAYRKNVKVIRLFNIVLIKMNLNLIASNWLGVPYSINNLDKRRLSIFVRKIQILFVLSEEVTQHNPADFHTYPIFSNNII